MATGANLKSLSGLLVSILGPGDDADLAVATLRQSKSLTEAIKTLRGNASLFKDSKTAPILRTLEAVVNISNCNVELLLSIGVGFRSHQSLSEIAMKYLLPPKSQGLDQNQWERELFRLEPTAVIRNLVSSGEILVPDKARAEVERILEIAMQQRLDLSAHQLRELGDISHDPPPVTPSHSKTPREKKQPSLSSSTPTNGSDAVRIALETIQTLHLPHCASPIDKAIWAVLLHRPHDSLVGAFFVFVRSVPFWIIAKE